MLEQINIEKVLFLDIETVPKSPHFSNLDVLEQQLWMHKAQFLKRFDNESVDEGYTRAGIYAEFGKIVCISIGHMVNVEGKRVLNMKSFFGHNEVDILKKFIEFVAYNFNKNSHLLCAHNGKEFDFPYLCRRILINRLKLPSILNIAGKKPWEIQHLDTMDLWRFGDYKSYTPLNLMASIFGIKSPKDDIDGSMVWKIYWEDKDVGRIKNYCQKDVETVVRLLLAMKGIEDIDDVQIEE